MFTRHSSTPSVLYLVDQDQKGVEKSFLVLLQTVFSAHLYHVFILWSLLGWEHMLPVSALLKYKVNREWSDRGVCSLNMILSKRFGYSMINSAVTKVWLPWEVKVSSSVVTATFSTSEVQLSPVLAQIPQPGNDWSLLLWWRKSLHWNMEIYV